MTANDKKTRLNRLRDIEKAYRLAKEKADALRLSLMGGKTANYSPSGANHVKDSNPVERAYCRLADYDADADRLLSELIAGRTKAESYINSMVCPAEREVLTRRYILGQRWEDIAESMGYENRYVYKIHVRALNNLPLGDG